MVVAPDGAIHRFVGEPIDGLVHVLGRGLCQAGKWSSVTYRVVSPRGTVPIKWHQSFEEGLFWPQDFWGEAFEWILERAPHADQASFEALVRKEWPAAAKKFDENEAAVERMTRE